MPGDNEQHFCQLGYPLRRVPSKNRLVGKAITVCSRKGEGEKENWYVQHTRGGQPIGRYFRQHKQEAEKYLTHCKEAKITAGTVNRDLAVLHQMFAKAKAWGLVQESP